MNVFIKIVEWVFALALVLVLPWYAYNCGYKRGWSEGLLEGGRAARSQKQEGPNA
jgi:hypothetical protein